LRRGWYGLGNENERIREKAERVGFEPTRRLNTAYAIFNLKRAPYPFRAQRPNLSHCVRLGWPLAAFVEVFVYPGVHCVRSRTGPVAVRLQYGLGSDVL
jgi:hypothetical protein